MAICDLKKWIQFILTTFFFAIIIFPVKLSAGVSITWVEADFPPIWIMEGSDKGNGILDGFISIYEKNLPEYEHHHVTANITRILSMMKDGQNVCHAGILKSSDRESFIYFSIPNCITNLHNIVFKKSRMNSLVGDSKSLSLEAILKSTELKLGVSKNNSYGVTIDKILEKHKENKNILYRSGQDNHLGLLRMLKEDRIDYMIGYPWEIAYIASRMDLRDEIYTVDITELEGQQWILSYVGCTKNEWGRQVIEKLNAILPRVRATDEYLFHFLKWFPDNIRPEVKKAYEERVLNVKE